MHQNRAVFCQKFFKKITLLRISSRIPSSSRIPLESFSTGSVTPSSSFQYVHPHLDTVVPSPTQLDQPILWDYYISFVHRPFRLIIIHMKFTTPCIDECLNVVIVIDEDIWIQVPIMFYIISISAVHNIKFQIK